MELDRLRYPIGQFRIPDEVSPAMTTGWIDEIAQLPAALRAAVGSLTPEQLATPYRPDGWRVRQVVHHLGDSHLNSFVRFKWALTEERPTIKAYFEDRWAELPDYDAPIEGSLQFIDALHLRWVCLLRVLSPTDLTKEFVHPESGPVSLALNIGIYAWHGRHHLAHITGLADRERWTP